MFYYIQTGRGLRNPTERRCWWGTWVPPSEPRRSLRRAKGQAPSPLPSALLLYRMWRPQHPQNAPEEIKARCGGLGGKTEKVGSRTPGVEHQWVWPGWATGQVQLVPVQGAEGDPSHALKAGGAGAESLERTSPSEVHSSWSTATLRGSPRGSQGF